MRRPLYSSRFISTLTTTNVATIILLILLFFSESPIRFADSISTFPPTSPSIAITLVPPSLLLSSTNSSSSSSSSSPLGPSPRCGHALIEISYRMARSMLPEDFDWRRVLGGENDDGNTGPNNNNFDPNVPPGTTTVDDSPLLTPRTIDDSQYSIAFMYGGTSSSPSPNPGTILSDAWLLFVSSTISTSDAVWIQLTNFTQSSALPPLSGYLISSTPSVNRSMTTTPSSLVHANSNTTVERLIIYGGETIDHALNIDVWEYALLPSWNGDTTTANASSPKWTKRASTSSTDSLSSPLPRLSSASFLIEGSLSSSTPDRILMFGGDTLIDSSSSLTSSSSFASSGSSLSLLSDFWSYTLLSNFSSTSNNNWTQLELNQTACPFLVTNGTSTNNNNLLCTDRASFQRRFVTISTLQSRLTSLSLLPYRPSDSASLINSLDEMLNLTTQLERIWGSAEIAQWDQYHQTNDQTCWNASRTCSMSASSSSLANSNINRPSSRSGHRMTLWQGTDPKTGAQVKKIVVYGGRTRCNTDDGSASFNSSSSSICYDPSIYFYDLLTSTWSPRASPPSSSSSPSSFDRTQTWPSGREGHVQVIENVNDESGATTQQRLWIYSGSSTTSRRLRTDIAMFDLWTQKWWIEGDEESGVDLTDNDNPNSPSNATSFYLTSYGLPTDNRLKGEGLASFQVLNQVWIWGDCPTAAGSSESTSSSTTTAATNSSSSSSLLLLKLSQRPLSSHIRILNDITSVYGQGASRSKPGNTSSEVNYFIMDLVENVGNRKGVWKDQRGREITRLNNEVQQSGNIPTTSSSPVPFFGPTLAWLTKEDARKVMKDVEARMIANGVGSESGDNSNTSVVATETSSTSNLPSLLLLPSSITSTSTPSRFLISYSLTSGSAYSIYIFYRGVLVQGAPWNMRVDTAEVSPQKTKALDPDGVVIEDGGSDGTSSSSTTTSSSSSLIHIPPLHYSPTGDILNQHSGSYYYVPLPLAGAGYGLIQGVRKATSSFYLQIVDKYGQEWRDNSNSLRYLNRSTNSVVVFDPLKIDLDLLMPSNDDGDSSSQPTYLRSLSLENEYTYLNLEDGKYLLTYRIPDMSSFVLQVRINNQTIEGNKYYAVHGTDPLELSAPQAIGMLTISVLLSFLMIVSMMYFFLHKHDSPYIQSRALLYDCMFTAGTILSTFCILERSVYSGGIHKDEYNSTYSNGNHNSCQFYNVLLGQCILLCYGALYCTIVRSRSIYSIVRRSTWTPDLIILNQDIPNCPEDQPIPQIPGVKAWWKIVAPVVACLVIELIFQTIWYGVSPLTPSVQIAHDGFRTYQVCSGSNKEVWIYFSIGMKGAMCAGMLYYVLNQSSSTHTRKRIGDPWNDEVQRIHLIGLNMTFSAVISILLVIFLDKQDSIKTSFIAQSIALFWSCLGYFVLIFVPRLYTMLWVDSRDALHRPNQFWYDTWILKIQEQEVNQKVKEEKEQKERAMMILMQQGEDHHNMHGVQWQQNQLYTGGGSGSNGGTGGGEQVKSNQHSRDMSRIVGGENGDTNGLNTSIGSGGGGGGGTSVLDTSGSQLSSPSFQPQLAPQGSFSPAQSASPPPQQPPTSGLASLSPTPPLAHHASTGRHSLTTPLPQPTLISAAGGSGAFPSASHARSSHATLSLKGAGQHSTAHSQHQHQLQSRPLPTAVIPPAASQSRRASFKTLTPFILHTPSQHSMLGGGGGGTMSVSGMHGTMTTPIHTPQHQNQHQHQQLSSTQQQQQLQQQQYQQHQHRRSSSPPHASQSPDQLNDTLPSTSLAPLSSPPSSGAIASPSLMTPVAVATSPSPAPPSHVLSAAPSSASSAATSPVAASGSSVKIHLASHSSSTATSPTHNSRR